MRPDFHVSVNKTVGRFSISSSGGGAPRWASIVDNQRDARFNSLRMDELRDLKYAIEAVLRVVDGPLDD